MVSYCLRGKHPPKVGSNAVYLLIHAVSSFSYVHRTLTCIAAWYINCTAQFEGHKYYKGYIMQMRSTYAELSRSPVRSASSLEKTFVRALFNL